MKVRMWRLLLLLFPLGSCFACIPCAFAATGLNVTLPILPNRTIGYSAQSGLQITVDSTWVGNRGYRPVRVTLSSPAVATADTQITVSFHAGLWQNRGRSITVEQDFELQQGDSSVTATLLVPQYLEWEGCGWEVWIDGKKDDELSIPATNFGTTRGNNRAALLLPGFAPNRLFSRNPFSDLYDSMPLNSLVLPESWASYSNLDVVATTPEGLQLSKVNSPQGLTQLLRWIRSGGNLWIFEVGTNYSKLSELETNLGLAIKQQQSVKNTDLLSLQERGWMFLPLDGKAKQGADALVTLRGLSQSVEQNVLPPSEQSGVLPPDSTNNTGNWFLARAYGMGTIVVFQDFRGQGWSGPAAEAVQLSLLEQRLDWTTRHGNDPARGNTNFADYLIPDVGTAPVFAFQLLISLFVLGIGPLNYWLLMRRKQLPMLLVTVPAAALLTTLFLFAYGLFSDGFGVQVRARSITLLDQDAGEAACWARLSYYAGFAPSDGLTIPNDTVVYPILPPKSQNNSFSRQYELHPREIEKGLNQNLTRGWLNSRTPTQYLAITARPSEKKIRFAKKAETLSATNQLGVDVLALAVQDHEGNFFLGKELASNDSLVLEPSNLIAAMMYLRPIFTENVLEFPAGYVSPSNNRRSWRNTQSLEYAPLSANLMESQIDSLISPLAEGWGNGTYVAITSKGLEVSLGIEGAVETDSFHVVRGTWKP